MAETYTREQLECGDADLGDTAADGDITPMHPGEILLEEFLQPMGISQNQLALSLRVPPIRISEIVRGRRSITADTALRLARYFGMSVDFWLNLQKDFDKRMAMRRLGNQIEREVIPRAA